jgi:multiple sugar transport system permease protein
MYTRWQPTPLNILKEIAIYGVLILFGIFMALPFIWTISTSLKPNREIFDTLSLIPREPTLEHYEKAFTLIPYFRYFANSLFLASAGVFTNLFFGSLAGYAFARLRFRGSKFLFRALLGSLLIPGVVTLIPTYVILKNFPLIGGNDLLGQGGNGLLNSYWAIILPGAVGSFAVFLMRQFFMTLPQELGEAARIDGCSEFGIFWRVYFPLCTPALATLGLFTFQAGWNNFLFPSIVLRSARELSTIQMGLAAFRFNYQTDYGPLMAATVVATLPLIVLFLFAQRFFTQGIAFTGAK